MNFFMKRILPLAFAGALALSAPAFANVPKEADTEPAVIVEVTDNPIATAEPEPTLPVSTDPFSIAGNGEILDDLSDGTKEFYTVTTENNKTFFIVVDKARNDQNVYMLAKVDEADVAEFIEGGLSTPEPTPAPTPQIIIQQPTPAPAAPVVQTEPAEEEPAIPSNYLLLGAGAIAALGALIYYKVIKPKKEREYDDDEGLEDDEEK